MTRKTDPPIGSVQKISRSVHRNRHYPPAGASSCVHQDIIRRFFEVSNFARRRCLIPVTAWAEAEGTKGSMTRTWYSLPDQDVFAVAGVWRPTAECGDAYSMVMVDGCDMMADVHDRMPTILAREDWSRWTDGTPDDAFALCQVWERPLNVDRTLEPWFKPRSPTVAGAGPILI